MSLYGYYIQEAYIQEGLFKKLKERREQKKAERERLHKEATDKTLLENLNMTLKFVKSPYTLGDGYDREVITILHKLGVGTEGLARFIKDHNSSKFDKTDWFAKQYDELSEDDMKKLSHGNIILIDDEYVFFLSLADNKLYELFGFELEPFSWKNYDELFCADLKDYKEISDKNNDILGQIDKLIVKYKK